MEKKVLTIYDLEDLSDAAEYIISTAQFNFYQYDDEGNNIVYGQPTQEHQTKLEEWINESKNNYLCFRYNEELHKISFSEALEMPLKEIKEKYLKDYLPKLRNMLRKDLGYLNGVVVSDDVPDEYLEDLLALRWRGNLVLWAMQWKNDMKKTELD